MTIAKISAEILSTAFSETLERCAQIQGFLRSSSSTLAIEDHSLPVVNNVIWSLDFQPDDYTQAHELMMETIGTMQMQIVTDWLLEHSPVTYQDI